MDVLEYQAKEWFREMGIPVLPSQRIDRPGDIKRLKIPYPVVLKSQVRVGGRGRAGGVRFVTNTIDAIAAAQTIFHLSILGELPEVLLAEAKYDADQEFYLAVVLDGAAHRPLLLGSPQGGIDVESAPELLQQVVVDQEFSPFYARRLTIKMGLQGPLIQTVSGIIEKMYQLFVQKDLDLVEINPLGVSSTGELMALDGKVTVNDRAIARHPDVAAMAEKIVQREKGRKYSLELGTWDEVEPSGNIAVLGNGAGLVMATMDLLTDAGSQPASCLNIGHGRSWNSTTPSFSDRLQQGLEFLSEQKNIQVVLVNILGTVPTPTELAPVIVSFVQRRERMGTGKSRNQTYSPRVIVRFAGADFDSAKEQLAAVQVPLVESLDQAIAQASRLAKSSGRRR
ncbi:succinate--CoA ligase subunit beta [Gloeocapsopsis dulcis]|uniref:ATPase n=1 Tax=Gloeocapsopsis dulcis AAB1 = 1H9 TaxID=1433147 RepID=A0A6N8FWA9_9CHRO|nr:succinate--CoA ligase subunit beta [Gloeocapsopsis dulcis]MUL37353.1 ATPase [Gloeocapsopsis dulcis AAB1 = 1H9]WNN88935.1 succinate--CoA ligase subunit beta [Gloeocapsopsis dulcis]